jgi:hypothetical protein
MRLNVPPVPLVKAIERLSGDHQIAYRRRRP